MKVNILREAGYDEAALGFSLSYNSTPERAKELFPKFAFGKSGETKFLESIYLWLDVDAPRFWWSEADTYRMSTKQSESTMHTLKRSVLTHEDFEPYITDEYLKFLNEVLEINEYGIDSIKGLLPEAFLQRRIWTINYRTLQNIFNQRRDHKLPQWKYFCAYMLEHVEHPEFLFMRTTGLIPRPS